MNGRIALIIPYFGPLPNWFPYFAKSVAQSPILDVLLFTDAQVDAAQFDNIKVYPSSLTEFCKMASRAFSIEISLTSPIKLCDFKPAFGEIFQDYIRDYEFWAFGDMDLVFGDAGAFLDSPAEPGRNQLQKRVDQRLVLCPQKLQGSECPLRAKSRLANSLLVAA